MVSFLFRITKKEIYMTKEEFVSYIFDKTVEMYAATYGSCNPLNKPEGKDDFDKIYRFLEDRYIKRLEDAGIKSPVKSPLSWELAGRHDRNFHPNRDGKLLLVLPEAVRWKSRSIGI